MSVLGGLHLACARGREAGCEAIQIFVKNERQWRAPALREEQARAFKDARKEHGIGIVVAHDSYLINMGSSDPDLWKKSVDAFTDELERCETLDLAGLVTHPGSHGGAGEEIGIANMIRGLDEVQRRTRGFRTRILLETTAGQGTSLGWNFGQLRGILDNLKEPARAGICFDTCHVFAAGYDLSTPGGYAAVMEEFDDVLGTNRLEAFHVNDSKKGLGSRVDRHEHIGRGEIGRRGFQCLMRDLRFRTVPKVLETPKEGDMDRNNLKLLRRLAGRS